MSTSEQSAIIPVESIAHDHPRYQYSALKNPDQNIRILTLLPGESYDALQIKIEEVEPTLCVPPPLPRLSLQELAKTLTTGGEYDHDYQVYATREGRYIFRSWIKNSDNPDGGIWSTSWRHPDENVPKGLYEGIPEDPYWEPKYEALSYCWGPSTPLVTVLVALRDTAYKDGEGDPSYFASIQIRNNLASALVRLRQPTKPRRLWVDALCINQEDIQERNAQVKRMKEIFALAERVILWLGNGDGDGNEGRNNSSKGLCELQRIGSQIEITPDFFHFLRPEVKDPTVQIMESSAAFTFSPPLTDECWENICELLERDWFYRMWVTQEVQLARNQGRDSPVVCGDTSIAWSELVRAMVLVAESPETPEWVPVQSHLYNDLRQAPVSYTLWILGGASCTLLHDHIYGAWSFMPAAFTRHLQLDYDAPLEHVLKDFTHAHIQHFRRLEVLSKCKLSGSGSSDPENPSWVFSPLHSPDKYSDYDFSAGYSRAYVCRISPDVLQSAGVICGTISEVSDAMGDTPADIVRHVVEWQQSNNIGKEFLRSFLQVTCGPYTQEREPLNLTHALSVDEIVEECGGAPLFARHLPFGEDAGEDWEENLSFYERQVIGDLMPSHFRLIKTEDHRVGLAPPGTMQGKYNT